MQKYGPVAVQSGPRTVTALFPNERNRFFAVVAELADAQDLGSCTVRCGGSSPSGRIFLKNSDTAKRLRFSGSLIDKGKTRF